MPELSRFFGIIIRMFPELGAPHHRPHFHAAYQNATATVALDPIECIGGELPRTQQRLVEAWAEIHHAELLEAWQLLQSGRSPHKIDPLR
ncbi:MAG: DUF4160 domain-containing protein [Vicinamibacterales bacterium]